MENDELVMKVIETILKYPKILDDIEPLSNLEPGNITRQGDSYLIVEKKKINDIRVGDSRIRPNQRVVYNIYLLAGLNGISSAIRNVNGQSIKTETTIHFNANRQIGPYKGLNLILSMPIDGKGTINRNVIDEKIALSLEKRGFSFPASDLNAMEDLDFIRVYKITPELMEALDAILYYPSEGPGAIGTLFREVRDKAVSEYGMRAGKKSKKNKKRIMKSKKNKSSRRVKKSSNRMSRKKRHAMK